MSLFSVFLFLIILLVLVIVHEFGHFIVAKWTNMRVDEFAFGFPPNLFTKKYGETKYSVNALPLGGFVSIWGENGEPNDEAKTHPRAFGNRPWWQQLLVLFAGVTMNMVLALVIFIGLSYGTTQISTSDEVYGVRVKDPVLVIVDAVQESPAYKAGLVPGTVLLEVKAGGRNADLTSPDALVSFIGNHPNDAFSITYRSISGVKSETTIASVYGIVPDKKAIGISVDSIGTIKTNVWESIMLGTRQTYQITTITLQGLWSLVTSFGKGENVLSSLSGPIGIAKIVGETSSYGIASVLTLVAVLSINLAIFNILPLPALDGGRIVVVCIETITRKKVPHKYYSWVNILGFLALMILLIVVTVHDIMG